MAILIEECGGKYKKIDIPWYVNNHHWDAIYSGIGALRKIQIIIDEVKLK